MAGLGITLQTDPTVMAMEEQIPSPVSPAPQWSSQSWPRPTLPWEIKLSPITNFSRPFYLAPMTATLVSGTSTPESPAFETTSKESCWSSPHFLIKGESWQARAERTGIPIPWKKPGHATQDWNSPDLRKRIVIPCSYCKREPVTGAKNSVSRLCRGCYVKYRKCIACNGFLKANEYLHCNSCLLDHWSPVPIQRCQDCGQYRPEQKSFSICLVDGRIHPCCPCRQEGQCNNAPTVKEKRERLAVAAKGEKRKRELIERAKNMEAAKKWALARSRKQQEGQQEEKYPWCRA